MIKLVAIDLDGTLLDGEKKISLRNREILKRAKEQGVKIVLCTGRPLRAIEQFLVELNLQEPGDYSITFNGGLVQKNDTGEVMEQAAMHLSDIQSLSELARELDLPMDIVSDDTSILLNTSEKNLSIYPEINPVLKVENSTVEELVENRLYNKVVVAYDQEYLDEQIKKIPAEVRDRYEVIKTRNNLLEFMPKGITKAYGISLLAKDLGIEASEVMCIGDEENDLPMIEYAGIGVAMKNAIEPVKAAADVITDSNEEDGVAKVVEKYVLN
ncbi:Cof-type HAD-IIB family hydrolase [Enterococcus olivae]